MDEQRQAFEKRIYQTWAVYWECDPALFSVPGVTLCQRINQGSSTGIHIWQIDRHTFVEHTPSHAEQVGRVLRGLDESEPVTGAKLAQGWPGQTIDAVTGGLIFHLFPEDLPESHLPGGFALRRLIEDDREQLQLLEEHNSPEDVSEAYVAVNHEMAFGIFQLRGQGEVPMLVTAASAYERTGFVDPGVLTHPDFRGRGFGSAAVHALCQWAIRQNRIMQYRCDQANAASRGLALRLGFRQFVVQDSIWLK